ncbi:4'-phosphopantetheinyl transferase family protein [Streptacidiphilus sp. PAMC 29251]
MIERLLPATVKASELFGDSVAILYPEEEASIAHAVHTRRREFTSVRVCARRSLARLGHAPVPLVPGADGAPGWPTGLVGSMTHCTGYRAAALARAEDVDAVGIDAEPHLPLPMGVEEAIALPAERREIDELHAAYSLIAWDRLLFSAKESLYKAWYPLTGQRLGFEDATVRLDPNGTFTARVLLPGAMSAEAFRGRWLAGAAHVMTAVVVAQAG